MSLISPTQVEDRIEIDGERGVPVVLGEVEQRAATVDAGVVRQDVDPAVRRGDIVDQLRARLSAGDVDRVASASRPRSRKPVATASASPSLTSQTTTCAPSDARRSQIAAPIPPPPPVTIATAFPNRATTSLPLPGEPPDEPRARPATLAKCWAWQLRSVVACLWFIRRVRESDCQIIVANTSSDAVTCYLLAFALSSDEFFGARSRGYNRWPSGSISTLPLSAISIRLRPSLATQIVMTILVFLMIGFDSELSRSAPRSVPSRSFVTDANHCRRRWCGGTGDCLSPAKAGCDVVVLEARTLGSAATHGNAAKIALAERAPFPRRE